MTGFYIKRNNRLEWAYTTETTEIVLSIAVSPGKGKNRFFPYIVA